MSVADPGVMRRINVSSTLRSLYDHGPASSAALQRTTGLSRRTLEVIANDLAEQGWILDEVPASSGKRQAGRPARRLHFNADAGLVLAAQLDFGYMNLRLTNLSGELLHDRRSDLATALPRDERIERFFTEVDLALTEAGGTRSDLLSVAIATPGIVRDNGCIDLPRTFLDWSNFPLRDRIAAGFDCEVVVENDAKLAALGEVVLADEGPDANFVWVRADGVRIGVGIVIEGRLYRGTDGAAGEIVWAPLLNFEAAQTHVFSGLVHESHPQHAAATALLRAAHDGDHDALEEVDSLAGVLAPGLQTLAWILAPHEIIIGGSLGTIGEPLVDAIQQRFRATAHPVEAQLRTSASSDEAIVTGATQTALANVRRTLFAGEPLPDAPRSSRLSRAT